MPDRTPSAAAPAARRPARPVRVAATALGLAAALALPARARGQAAAPPLPERVGVVADGTGALEARAVGRRFAERVGEPYRLEGLVLAVDDCGPDVDAFLDRALVHYGLSPRVGEMADDAVAWLVCRDRGVAQLAYAAGNPYADYLAYRDVAALMTAALADPAGGVAAAVTAGIDDVARRLGPAPRPTPLRAAAPASTPGPAPATGRAVAAVLAAAGLAWLGAHWRRARGRAARGAEGAWAERLEEVTRRMAALAPEFGGEAPRLGRLVGLCAPLGEMARVDLYRRHERMARRLAEAERLATADTGPLAARGAADDDAAEVRARREGLIVAVDGLRAYVERLAREGDHAEHLAGHAPEVIAAAHTALDVATARYDEAAAALADDPRVAPPASDAALARPRAWLEAAERLLSEARHLEAGRLAEDAADLGQRTMHVVRDLGAAELRVARVATALRAAPPHAAAGWRAVRGHGAEAEAALASAAAALRALVAAPDADLGSDPAAGLAANLGLVAADIARATDLCAALEARRARLADALEAAPGELAAASAALRALAPRLLAPPGPAAADAPEGADDPAAAMRAALGRAEDALVAAERALAAQPPDAAGARRAILRAERRLMAAALDGPGAGRRLAGRRRRALAAAVLEEAAEDLALRLAVARDDAGAVALRRAEDAAAAVAAARAALAAGPGLGPGTGAGAGAATAGRLRAGLAATVAAVGVVEEAAARLDADRATAERPRAAVRPAPAPEAPRPVAGRRGPFPGHFGDWPDVGRVAPRRRAVRWGAPPADAAGAQSWGAGIDGW